MPKETKQDRTIFYEDIRFDLPDYILDGILLISFEGLWEWTLTIMPKFYQT